MNRFKYWLRVFLIYLIIFYPIAFAKRELRYIDYFIEHDCQQPYIIKQLSLPQIDLLNKIDKSISISYCKEVLSRNFIYIGEYQAGNLHSLCFGIPGMKRIAYVRATIGSRSSIESAVLYDGYQIAPTLNKKSFLWRQLFGCIYEREADLPYIIKSKNINFISDLLNNYWKLKGYTCDKHEVDERGNNVLIFKREINWNYCIRALFENGVFKEIQYGIKDDFYPFTGII